jgi:predicted esterase
MERWRAYCLALACAGVFACSADGAGLGRNQEAAGCIPGASVPCACTDGTQGIQICGPSGDAFLTCDCGEASAPSTAGGTPTSGTGGTPSVGTGGVSTGTGGVLVATGGYSTGSGGTALPPEPPPPEPPPAEPPPPEPPPPLPPGSRDPVVPEITENCPTFADSTITFMGLGGIQIVAGAKPPSPTAPMVFYWHGTGSNSGEFAFMAAAVQQGVVAEGGVLVSFQNTTGGDLLSGTNIFGAGDFVLTDQLLACAVRDHNIDPRRVYTTGCSAGGLFSAAMAAMRSTYIAAAAPNSGGWVVPVTFQNDYTPPLMTIHGAPGQDVVVVDFSTTSATADQAFSARGGFVINCNHGGGHCGGGSLAPDIWEFFTAHPYGVDPEPWASGLPAGFSSVCEIY